MTCKVNCNMRWTLCQYFKIWLVRLHVKCRAKLKLRTLLIYHNNYHALKFCGNHKVIKNIEALLKPFRAPKAHPYAKRKLSPVRKNVIFPWWMSALPVRVSHMENKVCWSQSLNILSINIHCSWFRPPVCSVWKNKCVKKHHH